MSKITWTQWDNRLFPGFYESCLYNNDMLYDMTEYDEEGREWDFVEPNGYMDYEIAVCKACVEDIMDLMENNDAITEMKWKEMNSPQYYNFTTDKLVCELEVDMDKIKEWCYKTKRKEFAEYLKDNFTSCDGFISFVPNNIAEFHEDENTDVMIDFYILTHLYEPSYESGWERLWEYMAESANQCIYNYVEPKEKAKQENKKD